MTDLRTPDTIRVLESKEKMLAEQFNIESIKCGKIDTPLIPKLTPDIAPVYHIPNHFSLNESNVSHTTPLKKMHFLSNSPTTPTKSIEAHNLNNLSDDIKTQIFNLDTTLFDHLESDNCVHQSTNDTRLQENTEKKLNSIPEIKKMPQNMNIPSLWNVTIIEKSDNNQPSSSSSISRPELKRNDSEWELIDM